MSTSEGRSAIEVLRMANMDGIVGFAGDAGFGPDAAGLHEALHNGWLVYFRDASQGLQTRTLYRLTAAGHQAMVKAQVFNG